MMIVPVLAFAVIMLVNFIKGSPMEDFLYYFPFILVLIFGFFVADKKPAKGMMLFGTMGLIFILIGLMTTGRLALYAFISGGLYCSVMWPYIFSLSLAGLGNYTNQGSSLLIMMILGGAIIPPLQGLIADKTNIHFSYFIPALCFAYLAFYGWKVKHILKTQHIDYDKSTGSRH
jgi:FHS family L-fucose permease-like MFS transporter